MKRMMMTALGTMLLVQMAYAQPPEGGRRMHNRRRDEVEERLQTMKIWKLTDELQMSDEQAARFFPIMNEFDRRNDDLEKKRRDLLGELGEIVWDPNPDTNSIKKLMDEVEGLGDEQLKARRQFRKDVEGILKPDQMGKLLLFNARFPEVVRGLVRKMEDEDGPPMPPPFRRGNEW